MPEESQIISGVVQTEKNALGLLERVQVGSAIATGVLALTYVSGYLTATSYLGTYGVPTDTSEFLRAQYLYVGFEYWLFVAIFGVWFHAGGCVIRFLGSYSSQRDDKRDRSIAAQKILQRQNERVRQGGRSLRWVLVITLICSVFSFELMFMRPGEFVSCLPLQAVFLLSIALYQTTYYREFARESCTWGLASGVLLVSWIRWAYSVVTCSMFTALMAGTVLYPHLMHNKTFNSIYKNVDKFRGSWCAVGLGWFGVAVAVCVASVVTLDTEHLEWVEKKWPETEHPDPLPFAFKGLKYLFFVVGYAIFKFGCACWEGLRGRADERGVTSVWRFVAALFRGLLFPMITGLYCGIAFAVWRNSGYQIWGIQGITVCGYCTLVFALVVIANILLLALARVQRDKDLQEELAQAKLEMHIDVERREIAYETSRIVVRMAVPVVVLYLVSVFSFAHLVYPFIPIDKAGGNFSTSHPVFIDISDASDECRSKGLSRNIRPGLPFAVIEETPEWVYLAEWHSGQGPDCWKWGVFCRYLGPLKPPPPGFSRPKVYQVNRECVASIDADDDNENK